MEHAMPTEDPLNKELAIYEARRLEWFSLHPNEFVVIGGDRTEGFYADYESAFKAGIRAFGVTGQFLIKQVCAAEPVYVVY